MPEFSREIYSFVEIARQRSIRKAADKLNISSSALSRQMRLLEFDLGVQLFLRHVNGVQLTDQGRILLRQAQRWLDEGNELRAELSRQRPAEERVLRIGAMECFAGNLMPRLFTHIRAAGLSDRVETKFGGTDELIEDLAADRLDLVIAFNVHHSHLARVLFERPCRVGMIFSPELIEIGEPEISISRRLNLPICLPGEKLSLHTRLYAELLQHRRRTEIRAVSNSIEFIRELAMRGECISFLTWFDVRDRILSGHLRFVPLAERRLTETICVCLSGRRPLGATLAGLARKVVDILDSLDIAPAPE